MLRNLVSVALAVMSIIMISVLGHIHLIDKLIELDVSQDFCKAVYNHLVGQHVQKCDFLQGHLITDIVVLNINMFDP